MPYSMKKTEGIFMKAKTERLYKDVDMIVSEVVNSVYRAVTNFSESPKAVAK